MDDPLRPLDLSKNGDDAVTECDCPDPIIVFDEDGPYCFDCGADAA